MTASLELPDTLVKEAMRITHAPTAKVAVITALEFLVRQPNPRGIKKYFGKLDLDIDLDTLRGRV
jgi:Arc/MetJ family transcription regulator